MFENFIKKHTTRELVLLGLLIFLVVYYLAVQLPVSKIGAKIDSQQAEVDTQIAEDNDKITMLPIMKSKVLEYKNSGAPVTQLYDNTNSIIMDLNGIFGGAENYTINFGEKQRSEKIVRKNIKLQFSAASYNDGVKKIKALETSKNAYLLNATSITDNSARVGNSERVTVTVEMTAFEYDKDAK